MIILPAELIAIGLTNKDGSYINTADKLTFGPNQKVDIYSKGWRENDGVWGVSIGGKRGFIKNEDVYEEQVISTDLRFILPEELVLSRWKIEDETKQLVSSTEPFSVDDILDDLAHTLSDQPKETSSINHTDASVETVSEELRTFIIQMVDSNIQTSDSPMGFSVSTYGLSSPERESELLAFRTNLSSDKINQEVMNTLEPIKDNLNDETIASISIGNIYYTDNKYEDNQLEREPPEPRVYVSSMLEVSLTNEREMGITV